MAFRDIIDQEIVKRILQGALREKRIAHAYLFAGTVGTGKFFTALEFARAVNCLKGGDEPCGECSACRKISRLIHPDLILIFPLPPVSPGKKGKKEREEEEQKNRLKFIEEKLSNPYKIVRFKKPGTISIEEVRNAQRSLLYTPVEGKVKVLIVQEPEKMSKEAENSLLKTLEEPPRDSLLILLSPEPEKLLPTIVSRCQRIRFKRIPEGLMAEQLEKSLRLKEDKALHYARLSGGSLGLAFDLIEGEKEELRVKAVEFLKAILNEERIGLIKFVNQFLQDYERESMLEFLSNLSSLLRDIYLVLESKEEKRLLNPDFKSEIYALAGNFSQREKIQEALEIFEKTRADISRNVNLKLAFFNLGFELKRVTSGLRREKLVT